MFTHCRNIEISGGTFSVSVVNSAFEKLLKAAAPSAFHNSSARFDPPKCHPNTRVAVLEYLMGWIFEHNAPEARILWLYGPAGAGKSAILQTIAEYCFEHDILLASFFFSRSDSTRNTFKSLIPTIAYQIATAIPEIKTRIESIIERDPLIFDKSVDTQLQSLIIDPLKHLVASGFFHTFARLILIDGLDECNDPRMQSMILRVLANALREHNLPFIFLIASRPEQHITLTFNSPSLSGLWHSLVLDDSYKPDEDIRLFLEDSFKEIKLAHPHCHLIPEAWPEPSDIDKLVSKSSGQFIYASVVVKYVSAPMDRPPRRLEVVMGLRPARRDVPFAELDALYMHILGSCTDLDTVLSILAPVVCGIIQEVESIELFLDLEPGDAEIALAPLTSIIKQKDHQYCTSSKVRLNPSPRITLYHASFSDFLIDNSRSGPFYINPLIVMETTTSICLKKLMDHHSILSAHKVLWRDPLYWLQRTLEGSLCSIPLTDTLEKALKEFSLPRFWRLWSVGSGLHAAKKFHQIIFIDVFLDLLSPKNTIFHPPRPAFAKIYAFHVSSFEFIIESEVKIYYQDVKLMTLIVMTVLDGVVDLELMKQDKLIALMMLVGLTKESMDYDNNTLGITVDMDTSIFTTHYNYLFTGPRKSLELCFDGDRYAQTALSILKFLCDYPPYPILYQNVLREMQTSKARSRNRGGGASSQPSPPRKFQMTQKTGDSFPRKWRHEKHCHGVALSLPDVDDDEALQLRYPHIDFHFEFTLTRGACDLGLAYLPEILGRSSKSPELIDFIRRRGKDIVFMPKWTRKAIRAMYEYLERAEDADMIL